MKIYAVQGYFTYRSHIPWTPDFYYQSKDLVTKHCADLNKKEESEDSEVRWRWIEIELCDDDYLNRKDIIAQAEQVS